jgi:hypothetical protein
MKFPIYTGKSSSHVPVTTNQPWYFSPGILLRSCKILWFPIYFANDFANDPMIPVTTNQSLLFDLPCGNRAHLALAGVKHHPPGRASSWTKGCGSARGHEAMSDNSSRFKPSTNGGCSIYTYIYILCIYYVYIYIHTCVYVYITNYGMTSIQPTVGWNQQAIFWVTSKWRYK